MKKLLLKTSIFLFVFLIFLEIVCFLFNHHFRGINYTNSHLEKRSIHRAAALYKSENDKKHTPNLDWIDPEIHPYFGYIETRGKNGTNNHGFKSEFSYPYIRNKNDFIVGIFGGSVAMQLVYNKSSNSIIQKRIKRIISQNGDEKQVIILPFAIGGWKQPQTFYAFSYYFMNLDMVIVVDGYNEIIELKSDNTNWSYRYPTRKIYENLIKTKLSDDQLSIIGQIVTLRSINTRWTNIFSGNFTSKSMFLHTVWYLGSNQINNKINSLQHTLYKITGNKADNSPNGAKSYNSDDQINYYFRFYEQMSTWQSKLADIENIPYFHFLQPNQYVKNSKTFTQTERVLYLKSGHGMEEYITSKYSVLEGIFKRMKINGIHAYSLTRIFESTNETVYADDCCHLNTLGLTILANEIMDRVESYDIGKEDRI